MPTTLTQSPNQAAHDLAQRLAALTLADRLELVAGLPGRAVFTTSLGIEDQVITAEIAARRLDIEVVTLDTGRLFPETLALIDETEARYGIGIRRFAPTREAVAGYAETFGLDGFYESVEARHACCGVRKLGPLAAALDGAAFWIAGLRRGQSDNRGDTPFAEFDAARRLVKVNPLADWDIERVREHARRHDVPINPLHARGYPSIGCEPCTRAVKPGEPERAGRWWWERDDTRECGLHVQAADAAAADVQKAGA